jgi:predicted nuclease of predicted toxin-antitoxin system
MRVMLDHCTPATMRRHLPEHEVFTAAQMGWQTHQNGELIAVAEAAGFDTFVTSDQNIPNQVSMRNRQIAIIVLTSNHRPSVTARADAISEAIHQTPMGQVRIVTTPDIRTR